MDQMQSEIFSLHGSRALVVGGAGGIGVAITEGLLEFGARAVVVDSNPSAEQILTPLTNMSGFSGCLSFDIADRAQIRQSVFQAESLLGGYVDILIHAAGIQRRSPSEDFPEGDWDAILAINLTSAFIYAQTVSHKMLENGRGKIVNIASIMSWFGGVTIPAYAASKGGVAQLTKALSNDWAGRGICVNAIAPGYIDTPLNTALIHNSDRNSEVLARTPVKRWGVPADLKGAAVFLSSAASDFVTGAVIPVDGGYSAR
jgi:2-deoxy-D-gluconate 3-dehydrogenase